MSSSHAHTHTSDTVGKNVTLHLNLKQSSGGKDRQWTTCLIQCEQYLTFLLQRHGNYFDAQFKMITPIIEGNARGVCLIDNKGAV